MFNLGDRVRSLGNPKFGIGTIEKISKRSPLESKIYTVFFPEACKRRQCHDGVFLRELPETTGQLVDVEFGHWFLGAEEMELAEDVDDKFMLGDFVVDNKNPEFGVGNILEFGEENDLFKRLTICFPDASGKIGFFGHDGVRDNPSDVGESIGLGSGDVHLFRSENEITRVIPGTNLKTKEEEEKPMFKLGDKVVEKGYYSHGVGEVVTINYISGGKIDNYLVYFPALAEKRDGHDGKHFVPYRQDGKPKDCRFGHRFVDEDDLQLAEKVKKGGLLVGQESFKVGDRVVCNRAANPSAIGVGTVLGTVEDSDGTNKRYVVYFPESVEMEGGHDGVPLLGMKFYGGSLEDSEYGHFYLFGNEITLAESVPVATFKAGDKVRVKSFPEIERVCTFNGLGWRKDGVNISFVEAMKEYCGREYTVGSVAGDAIYFEEFSAYNFAAFMLEKAVSADSAMCLLKETGDFEKAVEALKLALEEQKTLVYRFNNGEVGIDFSETGFPRECMSAFKEVYGGELVEFDDTLSTVNNVAEKISYETEMLDMDWSKWKA